MIQQRLMTALVLAAGLLMTLFFVSPATGSLLFGSLLLIGAWEWARLIGLNSAVTRLAFVLLIAAVMAGVIALQIVGETVEQIVFVNSPNYTNIKDFTDENSVFKLSILYLNQYL